MKENNEKNRTELEEIVGTLLDDYTSDRIINRVELFDQPDKEVVLIVVPLAIKDDVLKAVYKNNGLASDGSGIVFSLPVTNTTLE